MKFQRGIKEQDIFAILGEDYAVSDVPSDAAHVMT
jgi:hypothetical protein